MHPRSLTDTKAPPPSAPGSPTSVSWDLRRSQAKARPLTGSRNPGWTRPRRQRSDQELGSWTLQRIGLVLATVTCWLDSGNPLSGDRRKELLITQNRMRLDLKLPSLLVFPVLFSSVLPTFQASLCQKPSPTTKVAGEPQGLLPCTPIGASGLESEFYNSILHTPRKFCPFFSFGVSSTPQNFPSSCALFAPLLWGPCDPECGGHTIFHNCGNPDSLPRLHAGCHV